MDHLQWSVRSRRSRPVVPFLSRRAYICPSLENYHLWPQINEWNIEAIYDLDELAARFQEWFFCGFLQILLQDEFDVDLFIAGENVSTSKLPDVLERTIPRNDVARMVESSTLEALSNAIALFEKWVRWAFGWKRTASVKFNVWDSGPCAVIFSIAILLDTVSDFLSDGTIAKATGIPEQKKAFTFHTQGIAESLALIGRCPSLVHRLKPSASRSYSLLSFPPSEETFAHNNCTMNHCETFNVNPKTYRPKHTKDCHDPMCKSQGFDFKDICNIIDRDQVPLVISVLDQDDNLRIELEAGSLHSQYTAISHVWAGGLGNFETNSLPSCQLRQIHDDISTITIPEVADGLSDLEPIIQYSNCLISKVGSLRTAPLPRRYWLDTLCVPVQGVPAVEEVLVNETQQKGKAPQRPTSPGCFDVGKSKQHAQLLTEMQPARLAPYSDDEDALSKDNADRNRQMASKIAAINSMGRIYAGAANVLVLDPELQAEQADQLSQRELLMSIICCPWMARSWTLQEGALATKIYLKFASGPLNFSDIRGKDHRLRASSVAAMWQHDILAKTHPARPTSFLSKLSTEFSQLAAPKDEVPPPRIKKSIREHESLRFCRVWNELAERSTTKPEDVAGIMAAMLNLSSGEILAFKDPEDRMKALLKSQSELPRSLLGAAAMTEKDWIAHFPDSRTANLTMDWSKGTMTVTKDGFQLENPSNLWIFINRNAPQTSEVNIYVPSQGKEWLLSFPRGYPRTLDGESGQILLWFMRMQTGSGRWLEIISQDQTGVRARLGGVFIRKHRKSQSVPSKGCANVPCHVLKSVSMAALTPLRDDQLVVRSMMIDLRMYSLRSLGSTYHRLTVHSNSRVA